jgi:hypothetical protein
LEPNVSNLLVAANGLLDEAVTRLRIKGHCRQPRSYCVA